MTGLVELVHDRIEDLARLPEVSDEWSARRPTKAAIEAAIRLSTLIDSAGLAAPEPLVFPTLDGGLQFEWRGTYRGVNLTILPDGRMEYVMAEKRCPLMEDEVSSDDDLRAVMRWLLEE